MQIYISRACVCVLKRWWTFFSGSFAHLFTAKALWGKTIKVLITEICSNLDKENITHVSRDQPNARHHKVGNKFFLPLKQHNAHCKTMHIAKISYISTSECRS